VKLTVITHTRDSAATLPRLLETTAWASERIVVDMCSRDDTMSFAEAAGCRVLHTEVVARVDGIRNDYLDFASHDWVLVLDSDEYLADDAEEAIERLIDNSDEGIEAFAIPRFNYIGAHLLRSTGWYPDHQIRLFRRGCVRWSDTTHKPPQVRGGSAALRILQPPGCLHIHHSNYRDLSEVLSRQLRYALDDTYDADPTLFNFGDCVTRAYQAFAARHHPEDDGDLSTALATIMAWDAVVRGLIHWDQLQRRPPLEQGFALPVTTAVPPGCERELEEAHQRLSQLEASQAELEASQAELEASQAELDTQLAASQAALDLTRRELAVIKASTVWRAFSSIRHRYPRLVAWSGHLLRSSFRLRSHRE
jgi:hypothetical protein